MTEQEKEVIDLAIKLRDAKFAVEEALLQQQFNHAVDMLKKERRDASAKHGESFRSKRK